MSVQPISGVNYVFDGTNWNAPGRPPLPRYSVPPPPPPGGDPPYPAGWTTLLFADYFTGTTVDLAKWNVRTDTQSNHCGRNMTKACTVANGMLSIRSGTDNTIDPVAHPYVSGYLDTIGKFSAVNFYAESRCRFPWGATAYGFWPAFWLRPDNGDTGYFGNGEIDVMEAWPRVTQVSATTWTQWSPQLRLGTEFVDVDWTTWHTFAVQKETGIMRYFVDGIQVADHSGVTNRAAVFDNDRTWHVRVQLQMGAKNADGSPGWGGWPDANTILSQTYDTDYVRVFGR